MSKAEKEPIDPECERFYKTYPRFPEVADCLELLRSGKAKGVWIDLICQGLTEQAPGRIEEMIAAFHAEPNAWVQILLLSSIAETGLSAFIPLLTKNLSSPQERLRDWAEVGLKKINTKESRSALWHYKHPS